MSRSAIRILIAVAVVGGVAAAWFSTRPRPLAVAVHVVARGDVEATVANTRAGTVKACRRSQIAPPVGGRIVRLPVRRGDHVSAGAVLLELWQEDVAARVRLAESEVEAAEARIEQVCLAAELAERDAARLGRLSNEGIVDPQTLDRAQSERDTTRAACRVARALRAEARARVGAARVELERATVRAPFPGIVADLNAEVGEVVIPSPPGIPTPPAIDLIEPGCLYVVAPLDEVDAPRLRVGQPARISLDAFPARAFAGTVRRVAPYVLDREKQARTIDVEVELDDPAAAPDWIPGYSADVEVLLATRSDVLFVPTAALIGEAAVLLLADGRIEQRAIEVGTSSWERTEVVTGLAEGDRVALSLDREGVAPGVAAEAERARR